MKIGLLDARSQDRWKVISVTKHELEKHLIQGWEPFSVTDSEGMLRYHLRTMVTEEL